MFMNWNNLFNERSDNV